MIGFFTDMLGRHRLYWALGLIAVNLILFFGFGLIWFWLIAITVILFFSAFIGEF